MEHFVAIHEAGHAVVADALGFTGIHVTTFIEGPSVGFTAPEEPTALEHYLLAVVSLAGGCAQMARDVAVAPDHGCLDDLNKAAESLARYAGLDEVPPPESGVLDDLLRKANALARDIIDIRWLAVKSLAEVIAASDGEVSTEQVSACLRGFDQGDE